MEFASKNPDANPFTSKKLHKDNLFTAASEAELEFEEDTTSLFSQVLDWLKPQQEQQKHKNNGQFKDVADSLEAIAKTFGENTTELKNLKTSYSDLQTKHSNLEKSFNELVTKLGGEPNSGTPPAPENTGNFSEQIDC